VSAERRYITPDSRYLVFGSYATGLAAGDSDYQSDVFVRDLASNVTTMESDAAPYCTSAPFNLSNGVSVTSSP
jgi:hypothetical protein